MKTKFLATAILLFCIQLGVGQTTLTSEEIVTAVKEQYRFDHAIDAGDISVASTEGIVELTGVVNNLRAKERATKLAEMVKGVRTVSNRIEVVPPSDLSDAMIRSNVTKALLDDPAADSYEVNVAVDNGTVTLTGTVDSYTEKELAGYVATSVKGVTGLQNDLKIEYAYERPDFELKREVEEVLKWNKWVDDGLILVDVEDGEVKLSGIVRSASEKSTAAWAAWINGVHSVDDSQLQVQWWAPDNDLRANKPSEVSDEAIEDAIKDAALYDPRVFSFNIEPDVTLGWVTLRGTVNNLQAKAAAESLAKNTYGVTGVNNQLEVRAETTPSDETIKADVENALALNAITEAWEINVSVDDGHVTLSGIVDSYTEKNEAEWVTSGVEGVTALTNNLEVSFPTSYYWYGTYPHYEWYYPTENISPTATIPDDQSIKMDVEKELWWSPFVDEEQVEVEVKYGEVTLTGTVDSWREFRSAEENAWEGGAWTVNNELDIRY